MAVSVTSLSSYLYCKRKLFLEKVLGFKEPSKPALIYGTIRHHALEQAYESEEQLVHSISSVDSIHIADLFAGAYHEHLRDSIKKHLPGLRAVNLDPLDALHNGQQSMRALSKHRATLVHHCALQSGLVGPALWDVLTPKIECETKIHNPSLDLTGIVDQIHHTQDDFYPVELKTGKAPSDGVWPGHRIQLAAYAVLLEQARNSPIDSGQVHYLDGNITRTIHINPFLKQEVHQLLDQVKALLKATELPEKCENKNKCARCGLKRQCDNEEFLVKRLREVNVQLTIS